MNRSKSQSLRSFSIVEVKSKYGAEFRRFSLDRSKPGKFEQFHKLILQLHRLANTPVVIGYADIQGDFLPINNDENFGKAVFTAHTLLRIFIQRPEEVDRGTYLHGSVSRQKKPAAIAAALHADVLRRRPPLQIGLPQDFRPVSSIIDVDILPETHRRVRMYRQGSEKPLGFYIRDGTTMKVTAHGLQKVPGVFISRMVAGGLAESTGLLAINDQVLEVNGIEVAGKTLDQVTDMMIANSHNLIITVKPVNQRNNIVRQSFSMSSCMELSVDGPSSCGGGVGTLYPGLPVLLANQRWIGEGGGGGGGGLESDDDGDVVIERHMKQPSRHGHAASPSVPRPPTPPRMRAHSRPKSPSGGQRRPHSMIVTSSAASSSAYHRSQPCLHVPMSPSDLLSANLCHHLTLQQQYGSSPTVRGSTASLHSSMLRTLRTEPLPSLAMGQGGMEEDGIVVIL
ncbi:par-6 family cell polarity regulator gamma a [Engraulis encrasicolus]|uniref:par-6 family cell polarity regulator gamma a n=1 Tax=Engraulis encrasicolus TaxID=184585 RepID=UPI002FD01068